MIYDIDYGFLEKAVEGNDALTMVWEEAGKSPQRYRSRFLGWDGSLSFLVIDQPTPEGESFKPLLPEDKVTVFFQVSGFRFLFHTRVSGKSEFALNDRMTVSAMRLVKPALIEDGERRNHFRVPVPRERPVTLRFFIYKEGSKELLVDRDLPGIRPISYELSVTDISGGGLSVKAERNVPLKPGDKVQMTIVMRYDNNQMLKIDGIVRNRRRVSEGDMDVWGIEFLAERNVEFRYTLTRVNRYVMDRQREMLKS